MIFELLEYVSLPEALGLLGVMVFCLRALGS